MVRVGGDGGGVNAPDTWRLFYVFFNELLEMLRDEALGF